MTERSCSVEGCTRQPRHQRTKCGYHERLWWKYGTTDPPEKPPRPTICSIEGCGRPYRAKGLCASHYARVRNYGGLNPDSPIRSQGLPLEERFWACVDQSPGPDACWEWTGYRNNRRGGYGFLSKHYGGKQRIILAHRLSWELANGQPVPKGLVVRHSCDNPPCVNPRHLSVGTAADNAADAVARGRTRRQFGESSGKAKFTNGAVLTMRARAAAGESFQSLAQEYDTSAQYVGMIVRRERWAHI